MPPKPKAIVQQSLSKESKITRTIKNKEATKLRFGITEPKKLKEKHKRLSKRVKTFLPGIDTIDKTIKELRSFLQPFLKNNRAERRKKRTFSYLEGLYNDAINN